jgi:hypothetical protein
MIRSAPHHKTASRTIATRPGDSYVVGLRGGDSTPLVTNVSTSDSQTTTHTDSLVLTDCFKDLWRFVHFAVKVLLNGSTSQRAVKSRLRRMQD